MVNAFQRKLPDGALEYLGTMPSWWQDVLAYRYKDRQGASQPLLIALRDGYLNVYAEGQSVLKVGFDTRRHGNVRVRCRIHHKYVPESNSRSVYLDFDGLRITQGRGRDVIQTYAGPETLHGWVEAARTHSGDEKKGVAIIANRHLNVIDVEMALPADEPVKPDGRKVANRMDIVALEPEGEGARIVFYEAKLFSNPQLRAEDLSPPVLRQLGTYRDYVSQPVRHQQILAAYRNACAVLDAISRMRGTEPSPLVRRVAEGGPISLDVEPRLIIFGKQEQRIRSQAAWDKHKQILHENCIIIHSENPEEIRLGL
ncbi:hypothetical protein [Microvirga yunnanensis]|uniref:hypothetical protein n=1 Tax=Microvirga yunnanensis TaxID=2953740 RepID=UPI0021C65BBE|nr:hypothetical protein [Microvirga sp. HBU65207]